MRELEMIDLEPLLAETSVSAVHLEMRDECGPSDEPAYSQWQAGRQADDIAAEYLAAINREPHTSRGVQFRRARIVSEPVSEYVRFLHEITSGSLLPAGEDVRWLPRRNASDLCLPGNDFWLLDSRLVRFGYFSGDGLLLGHEISTDPAVVKLCRSAFESVWERAIPHEAYAPAVER